MTRADWSKFKQASIKLISNLEFTSSFKVDKKQLAKLDKLLSEDMSRLVAMIPTEMTAMGQATLNGPIEASEDFTPFNLAQGIHRKWSVEDGCDQWIVTKDPTKAAR